MKNRSVVAFVMIALLLSTVACSSLSQPGPSEVIQDYWKAMDSGDADAAIEHHSRGVVLYLGEDESRRKLFEGCQHLSDIGGVISVEIIDESITDDVATVTAQIDIADGTQTLTTYTLVKENGAWKMAVAH